MVPSGRGGSSAGSLLLSVVRGPLLKERSYRPLGTKHQALGTKKRKGHLMKDGQRGYRDLKVYKLAYKLAMDIFEVTKSFPPEERYSLTDQIRKSSRSVAANIAEAWKRRQYPKMFISKTIDSASEAAETEVWLDFSKDCGYLDRAKYNQLIEI